MKVAHHGSKFSTDKEFLNMVSPRFSIISAGRNNIYNHPHEELMQRLTQIETNIKSTSKIGAITLITDGYDMNIQGYLEK